MAQWQFVAGRRQIKRRPDLHLRVAKERPPATHEDPFAASYRMPMGDDGKRETWPGYLRRMTSMPGWSVARLARESGIHRATIFRWIKGEGGANVTSVHAIADAFGDDRANALRAAANMDGNVDGNTDPDLLLLTKRLADPAVPDEEKSAIRVALRYLAELAEQSETKRRPPRRRAS